MSETWPELELPGWRDTRETLHRYTQVIGKIQLATTPLVSHFWNVALKLTARGLGTSAMPYQGRTFDIELDLVEHIVTFRVSDGGQRTLPLRDRTVADFDADVMAALGGLGIEVPIWHQPVEIVSEAIPFREDKKHHAYDPEWVTRFWRVLAQTEQVLADFRSRFIGKASPVGFYWGTFDLCAARYSGARVPNPPSGTIESEAFSHDVSEAGFWPGDARLDEPAFYGLHIPAPEGYASSPIRPAGVTWCGPLGCFVLPYAIVRTMSSPRDALLEFFESSYAAGATLAGWKRDELERAPDGQDAALRPVPARPDASG